MHKCLEFKKYLLTRKFEIKAFCACVPIKALPSIFPPLSKAEIIVEIIEGASYSL